MRTSDIIEDLAVPDPMTGCWLWHGPVSQASGYGIALGTFAHRAAYKLFKGPLLRGFVIDHVCRNKGCVNPDHLRQVTPKQNSANVAPQWWRMGQQLDWRTNRMCDNGHIWEPDNCHWEMIDGQWLKACKTCADGKLYPREEEYQ